MSDIVLGGIIGGNTFGLLDTEDFEVALCKPLIRFGPLIAVGRPGEKVPTLGAAREYLADNEWKSYVLSLMHKCSRVIVLVGETDGLAWEMSQLVKFDFLEKVILLLPPVLNPDMQSRWQTFRRSFYLSDRLQLPEIVPAHAILGVFDRQFEFHFIIHEDIDRWNYSANNCIDPYIESIMQYFEEKMAR